MDASVAEPVSVNPYTSDGLCEPRHAETSSTEQRAARPPTPDELLAAELGRLASQHHTSEYNRLKYRGGLGPSGVYVPLCLYMPDHFRQLQVQQARYALMQAWWPCPERKSKPPETIKVGAACTRAPTLFRPSGSMDLQSDLLIAIDSPFVPQIMHAPVLDIKTSETHPINISSVVPTELLPLISAHITKADSQSPVMFNIPHPFQLHHLLSVSWNGSSTTGFLPHRHTHPLTEKLSAPTPNTSRRVNLVNMFWNQKLVRSTVLPTISASKLRTGRTVPSPSPSTSIPALPRTWGVQGQHASIPQSRNYVPMPPSFPQAVPSALQGTFAGAYPYRSAYAIEKISYSPVDHSSYSKIPSSRNKAEPHTRIPKACDTSSLPMDIDHTPQHHEYTLGNLLLSSCPGKKVRVDGPANGRSGVRRDVYQDMKRIKEFGAECIVCCLDDEELEFLGAPWEEYAATAHNLGMDILRLPTPEGLAPASTEDFDRHLQRIIDTYTLRGSSVLVHCRGGIGRAGLVACCWMIKLGLCGWIDTQPIQLQNTPTKELPPGIPPIAMVRHDTLQLVEHVIALIRRRRSLKAIETFEQVRFLMEYVEFLRSRAGQREIRLGSVLERDIRMN